MVVVVVPSSCCEDSVCVHCDQSIVGGGIKSRYSAILHHTGLGKGGSTGGQGGQNPPKIHSVYLVVVAHPDTRIVPDV